MNKMMEGYSDINGLFALADQAFNNSLLQQKGIAIWLMGLSGAGKTTIARLLEQQLKEDNYFSLTLDGDVLRNSINKDLSFTQADRAENIRRAAEIAKLLVKKNVITICSFITPLQQHRDIAASILGDTYFEIYTECPLPVCEERDVKGLYKKARNNEITDFTGIGSGFEVPQYPWLTLHTANQSPEQSAAILLKHILPHITSKNL
ncbi:MAG: adenylyl-sulfate kinase [Agriterribacter sp.]